MKASASSQRDLLDLATLDSRLQHLRHQVKVLPQIATLNELNEQRQAIAEDIIATSTRLDDAKLVVERAKEDLLPAQARLERNQQRLDSSVLTTEREISAVQSEIDHLTNRIEDLETAQLEAMSQVDEAQAALEVMKERKSAIENEMRELIASRDADAAQLKRDYLDIKADRTALAGRIPADLLAFYDKISAHMGLPGVGALVDGKCTGCGLPLAAIDLNEVLATPADIVVTCEQCGRILVR